MSNWSDRTSYHGKRVNKGTWYILQAANKMLATSKFGGEKGPVTVLQGSYSGAVAASAGTHNGGGAIDTTAHNWRNREKVFRLLGVAFWDRPARRGVWIHHCHGIVDGDGTASAGAKRQVTAYHNRRDGLAGSGPDRGYRMMVFPLFVFPEKQVGKPGPRYCTTACHVYEQPTVNSKNLGPVREGERLDVVAVVNVDGRYWGITADGRCAYEGNFSRTKPAADGTTPAPTPAPAPPVSTPVAQIRALNINVGADYVAGYSNRLDELAKVRDKARASLVLTCESGNYDDGARLNRAFGWSGVRERSFILHGGSVPITTAVHWDETKYTLDAEGQFITVPGTTHRWATWVVLRHKDAGQKLLVVVTHLQYLPKGPNNIRRYDQEREAQFAATLKRAEILAVDHGSTRKPLPVIAGGDLNGRRTDPYDGPGRAAQRYGYKECATEALRKIGGSAPQIDRLMVKRCTVDEHTILPTLGGTDHDTAVATLVTLA